MQLANQVPTWILGKLSSVLQITDTGYARPVKVFAVEEKAQIRQELKAIAVQTGTRQSLTCKPVEILTIIHGALRRLKAYSDEKNLVLAEGLRNALLAYRPNWSTGKLVPVVEQAWTKDLPKLGESHRLRKDWSRDRLKWTDADGIPVEPQMKTKTCKGLEDFADNAAVAGPHEVTVTVDTKAGEPIVQGPNTTVAGQVFEEEQGCLGVFGGFDDSLEDDFFAMSLKQISQRSRLKEMEVTNLLSSQRTKRVPDLKKKLAKAKEMHKAYKEWRAKTRGQLEKDKLSRMEGLDALEPSAGPRAKAKTTVKGMLKGIATKFFRILERIQLFFMDSYEFHMIFYGFL